MHITAVQAAHFAYVVSECKKRGISTFEPTQEAEEAWCDTIVKGTAIRANFFKECTPGYYNNEGGGGGERLGGNRVTPCRAPGSHRRTSRHARIVGPASSRPEKPERPSSSQ